MNQSIEVPAIKKIKAQQVFRGGMQSYTVRYVTRVFFKDGKALTFAGELSRKEAIYQGYFQRALEAGLSLVDAESFAGSKYPIPQGKGV